VALCVEIIPMPKLGKVSVPPFWFMTSTLCEFSHLLEQSTEQTSKEQFEVKGL